MADEFAADVGVDSAPTAALLDGLALGAALRARLTHMHVTRLGPTLVRVDVPVVADFPDLTAPQLVAVVLPASALASNVAPLAVTPPFVIKAQPGTVTMYPPSTTDEAAMRQSFVTYQARLDLTPGAPPREKS